MGKCETVKKRSLFKKIIEDFPKVWKQKWQFESSTEVNLLDYSIRQDKTRFYLYNLKHTGVQEDIANSHSI